MRLTVCILAFATLFVAAPARTEEPDAEKQRWEKSYESKIWSIIQSRCIDCHGEEEPDGELNLEAFKSGEAVSAQTELWDEVGKRVRLKEMPPEGSPQLTDREKGRIHRWLDSRPGRNLCDTVATDENQSWYIGYVMSRRLTRTEYVHAIRDLTGFSLAPEMQPPSDGSGGEGFDTSGDSLFTSPIHVERYLAIASNVVERAIGANTKQTQQEDQVPESPLQRAFQASSDTKLETARVTIAEFARRAWRRPVEDVEIDRLMRLMTSCTDRGMSIEAALAEPLKAILVSPHFLFVIEPEAPEGGVQKLTQHQLAMRLSLFLWSSIPDRALLEAADRGELATDDQILAQSRRMLDDPRSETLGSNFGLQWLGLTDLETKTQPDPELYPEFDQKLASDLRREAEMLVAGIFREDRSILELIDSDEVHINGNLASHYGLDLPPNANWQRLKTPDRRRGGVATLGAVLMSASYPRRTSPVLRGRWILEEVLGSDVPPPPPDVPPLDESHASDAMTLRQRLEIHRTNPTCASCHNRMDPLGFGLENYDVLGRWRDDDSGQPIDASGKLPSGETFQGPEELKQLLLRRSDEFESHFVRKVIGFAFGRELNKFDKCVIEDCAKALRDREYRSSAIIETIVTSFPFQHRYFKPAAKP